jgi:hypothetical protein
MINLTHRQLHILDQNRYFYSWMTMGKDQEGMEAEYNREECTIKGNSTLQLVTLKKRL